MKLLVCYVSGLDRRRVGPRSTPFVSAALKRYPAVKVANLPSNELLPTMLTGVYPGQHGVWGVKRAAQGGLRPRWFERLPDLVTTTAQCLAHQLTYQFDLPAVPPWRRRRFDITRTKYLRRRWPQDTLERIGGVTSLLGLLGPRQSRYCFSAATHPTARLLPRIGHGDCQLEWVEFYALDRVQQWRRGDDRRVDRYYREVDDFLSALHAKCQAHGVVLVLLSDHGHEPVRGAIDVRRRLRRTAVPRTQYSFFLELSILRLWFFTDRARQTIDAALRGMDHLRVFGYEQLREFHLSFSDTRYGELFAFADPGYIFFPHDFHHPLANLWLALTDVKQLPRLTDPRQRHNHGYLAPHPCEDGLFLLLDESWAPARDQIELTDIAPSLLDLLQRDRPDHMVGRSGFVKAERLAG